MCLLEFSMSGVIPKTPTTVFSVLLTTRSVEVCVGFSRLCIYVCTYMRMYVLISSLYPFMHIRMYVHTYVYTYVGMYARCHGDLIISKCT